jgi:hypothetical protein
MRGGDISNETPPRIIVLIDTVANSSVEDVRGFLKSGKERKVGTLNHLALSKLWSVADKFGLSVELAAFEDEHWTQEHLDNFMDKLDRRGANPFNYAELYTSIEDFIGDLPYRSNLKGVIDLRERVARYGSWGIEIENL